MMNDLTDRSTHTQTLAHNLIQFLNVEQKCDLVSTTILFTRSKRFRVSGKTKKNECLLRSMYICGWRIGRELSLIRATIITIIIIMFYIIPREWWVMKIKMHRSDDSKQLNWHLKANKLKKKLQHILISHLGWFYANRNLSNLAILSYTHRWYPFWL